MAQFRFSDARPPSLQPPRPDFDAPAGVVGKETKFAGAAQSYSVALVRITHVSDKSGDLDNAEITVVTRTVSSKASIIKSIQARRVDVDLGNTKLKKWSLGGPQRLTEGQTVYCNGHHVVEVAVAAGNLRGQWVKIKLPKFPGAQASGKMTYDSVVATCELHYEIVSDAKPMQQGQIDPDTVAASRETALLWPDDYKGAILPFLFWHAKLPALQQSAWADAAATLPNEYQTLLHEDWLQYNGPGKVVRPPDPEYLPYGCIWSALCYSFRWAPTLCWTTLMRILSDGLFLTLSGIKRLPSSYRKMPVLSAPVYNFHVRASMVQGDGTPFSSHFFCQHPANADIGSSITLQYSASTKVTHKVYSHKLASESGCHLKAGGIAYVLPWQTWALYRAFAYVYSGATSGFPANQTMLSGLLTGPQISNLLIDFCDMKPVPIQITSPLVAYSKFLEDIVGAIWQASDLLEAGAGFGLLQLPGFANFPPPPSKNPPIASEKSGPSSDKPPAQFEAEDKPKPPPAPEKPKDFDARSGAFWYSLLSCSNTRVSTNSAVPMRKYTYAGEDYQIWCRDIPNGGGGPELKEISKWTTTMTMILYYPAATLDVQLAPLPGYI